MAEKSHSAPKTFQDDQLGKAKATEYLQDPVLQDPQDVQDMEIDEMEFLGASLDVQEELQDLGCNLGILEDSKEKMSEIVEQEMPAAEASDEEMSALEVSYGEIPTLGGCDEEMPDAEESDGKELVGSRNMPAVKRKHEGVRPKPVEDIVPDLISLEIIEENIKPRFARSLGKLRSWVIKSKRGEVPGNILPVIVREDFRSSRTPLKRLRRINLFDLNLRQTYRGGYLILRTLEPPFGKHGVTTVVEDPEGNSALFVLYNATTDIEPENELKYENILPSGTVFVLKEPLCNQSRKGDCILLCESPSDMIVVYHGQKLGGAIPDEISWRHDVNNPLWNPNKQRPATEWLYYGNSYCFSKKFMTALNCYYIGLQVSEKFGDKEGVAVLLSRRLVNAYFQLGFYEKAISIADNIPEGKSFCENTLFCTVKCMFRLRRYQDANTLLMKYETELGKGKEFNDLLLKTRRLIYDNWSGKHDINEIFTNERNAPSIPIDCSDYMGPIHVVALGDKGRGVVATRSISPGEMVSVSKALIYKWEVDYERNPVFEARQQELWEYMIVDLAQMIVKNPKTYGTIIYALSSGMWHVEDAPLYCDAENQEEPIAHIRKIKYILRNNFYGNNSDADDVQRANLLNYKPKSGCGLFDIFSYFNHSCLTNTSILQHNDVLFVRAVKPIDVGEEIVISYVSWELPIVAKDTFFETCGFHCLCEICEEEKGLSPTMKAIRMKICTERKHIQRILSANVVYDVEELKSNITHMLDKFKATYSKSQKFPVTLPLSTFTNLHAKVYAKQMQIQDEIDAHMMTLKFHGFDSESIADNCDTPSQVNEILTTAILDENAIFAVTRIVHLYRVSRQTKEQFSWLNVLFQLESAYSGNNYDTLEVKHTVLTDVYVLNS